MFALTCRFGGLENGTECRLARVCWLFAGLFAGSRGVEAEKILKLFIRESRAQPDHTRACV